MQDILAKPSFVIEPPSRLRAVSGMRDDGALYRHSQGRLIIIRPEQAVKMQRPAVHAAGSLKTETMLVDAARESGNPNLRAIIFRQQFTQMTDIVDKTHTLYKAMGANYVGPPVWTWTFPSGAKIRLAYISTTLRP